MKLKKVLENIPTKSVIDNEVEVVGLYHSSKEVKEGGMFFAIDGTHVSGREYVNEAIENGASVVVSSQALQVPSYVTNVVVDDVRLAMSLSANNFYEEPSRDMFIMGVTGTNGKTTTTFMLESVFKEAGHKVGVIGTNGVYINGEKIDTNLTTPDPIYLQKTLAKMRDEKIDVVCMEVSAHALELQKIRGVMTDIALFTNLTQDHLDFFDNMKKYGEAKAKFFEEGMARFGVVNLDDEFGRTLFENAQIPMLTYSREKNNMVKNNQEADIIAVNERHNTSSQTFDVITPKGKQTITLNMSGGFNVSNALGVITASLMAGIDLKTIASGLSKLEKVEGRFNTYDIGGVRVIVDYAHTPDGLENILRATKEITEGKVICVFGCGGNRDSAKRPIMGGISERLADYTIITNDNPRFEKPEDIAKDIIAGITNKEAYSVSLDRKKAIKLAVSMAKAGDSVVVAGKGAEPYIDMLGVKTPYEDRLVIEEILEEIKNKG